MLIRLLPIPPHPSIVFNIDFEDLPEGLILPQTWTTHLSNLMHDELPMPRFQHALDKATFLPCILQEVIFDVPALLVTCRFIDGTSEERKIEREGIGAKCLKTLESVISDVNLSSLGIEREQQRAEQREKEREWEREREKLRLLQNGSSSSVKSVKHKKKRSLLMTIVSSLSSLNSIINLSLPSPTISTFSSPPSAPSSLRKSASNLSIPTFKPAVPSPQDICPRFLRRRARSSLVDAFRLYVVHELSQRLPPGGYYIWVLHSLLNEARRRRDEFLAREREFERERERERLRLMGPPSPYMSPTLPPSPSFLSTLSSSSTGSGSLIMFGRRKLNPKYEGVSTGETETFSATTSSEPPTSDDDEEPEFAINHTHARAESDETDRYADTVETDTDGSSLQTPTSSHFTLPLPSGLPSAAASEHLPSLLIPNQLQSFPSSPFPSATDLQIQNLTHLILLHNSHAARAANDENNRLDALEVRGRRRAWLNRALCPNGLRLAGSAGGRMGRDLHGMKIGVGAGYSGLGFSVPIRRSTLGMWVRNAEDVRLEEIAQATKGCDPGQHHAIILEDEDVQFVDADNFSGYDERNGIEPKRFKIPLPSNGTQLLPVNEVEEEEEMDTQLVPPRIPPRISSKSTDSVDQGDDDDIKFENLNLNQYDDLRELQMDLDIVTGVGFDMMDSSDEEDNVDSEPGVSIPDGNVELPESGIPVGGIRVAFDIPRPKTLYARPAHLLSGHEPRQKLCQRRRMFGAPCDPEHHVHQYFHPDTLPERCQTPIPQLHPPRVFGQGLESLDVAPSPPTSVPAASSVSVPQSSHFRTLLTNPPPYAVGTPNMPINAIPTRASKEPLTLPSRPPSRATLRQLVPGHYMTNNNPELNPFPCDVSVSEMGEFVAGMEAVGLGEDEDEEFTLAMDLPSKVLKSRFGGMSFATMGQSQCFKGRVRGATRLRGSQVEMDEGLSVVTEDAETISCSLNP